MGKEIAVSEQQPVETLIAKAIEHNVSIETMEKLLAMRRELKAEAAKEAFFRDLSAFQAACPVIKKTKEVRGKDGKIRYRYAPLDDIISQIGKILEEHGFSYTVQPKHNGDHMGAVCTLHHVDGHDESSEFNVPIDKEAYMNEPQKYASALTYAKRYAFCAVTGILTGEEDDDAQNVQPVYTGEQERKPEVKQPQAQAKVDDLKAQIKKVVQHPHFRGMVEWKGHEMDLDHYRPKTLSQLPNVNSIGQLQTSLAQFEEMLALAIERDDKQAPDVEQDLGDDELQGALDEIEEQDERRDFLRSEM